MPETFFLMELVEKRTFRTKSPHRNSVIVEVHLAHVKLQKGKIYRETKFQLFSLLLDAHT